MPSALYVGSFELALRLPSSSSDPSVCTLCALCWETTITVLVCQLLYEILEVYPNLPVTRTGHERLNIWGMLLKKQ